MTKEIKLTQGKVTLVDDEDFERLNQWKWAAYKDGNNFYALRNIRLGHSKKKRKTKQFRMHRVIMDVPKGEVIDHINGDGLDNRKSNLRICSNRQNLQNQKHRKNKTSRYPGVSWHKSAKKWVAQIVLKGKTKHLGTFADEREAARTYEKAVRESVGEELICKIKRRVLISTSK
ncbi:HNH endonuclease [Methanobacterium spitsbergense]|uniref:HNH endonuclease n=1 Tax=Methanobacterium spitsbergense TaxID=2874285 RepID=A0A8T5UVQ9_9EURY|nr:HNH endonuclease [Methanobacterium spitsbergense]MBZ2166337.1 HNH endonuclease [Methanobacterium spitsbergense]